MSTGRMFRQKDNKQVKPSCYLLLTFFIVPDWMINKLVSPFLTKYGCLLNGFLTHFSYVWFNFKHLTNTLNGKVFLTQRQHPCQTVLLLVWPGSAWIWCIATDCKKIIFYIFKPAGHGSWLIRLKIALFQSLTPFSVHFLIISACNVEF